MKNIEGFESCWPEKKRVPLTGKGKEQVKNSARSLLRKGSDLIFSSDILRAKQTAEIAGRILKIKPKFDKRLREIDIGDFNGQSVVNFGEFWNKGEKISPLEYYSRRFKVSAPGGESYDQVEKRLSGFFKEMERKYQGKKIIVVSHSRPLALLEKLIKNYSLKRFVNMIIKKKEIKTGQIRKLWK